MDTDLTEQYAWADALLRFKYYNEYCVDLTEQYAWADDLLRYKYYNEYCFDVNNVSSDLNEPLTDDMLVDDEEEQDDRLLARKRLRHYPLSDVDADILQACVEMGSEEMDVEEESQPHVWCQVCRKDIPLCDSLRHELLCVPCPQATSEVKTTTGLYCDYCDIHFDNVHDYVMHDAHCLGYNWQATLEEGLYYENAPRPEEVHEMDVDFEVGNMEWF